MLEELQKLGLSDKEATIYLALAKHGKSTANFLAKQTSTNRTFTYNILQQLVDKGIINYINEKNKRFYTISNPESLLNSIKEKELLAKEIIPKINKIKAKTQSNRNVEIYEGLEGMKSIFEEIRKTKELRVLNATGLIFENLKFSAKHIVKDIEKQKVKIIAVPSMKKTPMIKFKKMEIKYLPKEAENYATTFIYGGKTIIMTLKDKPFLIKIENEEICDGYKKDFEVLWKASKS